MKHKKPPRPPRLLHFFLKHLTLYDAHHSILGDFEESFRMITRNRGILRAQLWYTAQVLQSLVAYFKLLAAAGFGLFFNYLKLTLRNLRRHQLYTAINICGLSVGLAAVILIFLYMRFETSYDCYHLDADHIYRIVDQEYTAIPYILGDMLQDQSPEIKDMVRIKELTIWGPLLLNIEEKQVLEDRLFMVEPSIVQIFSYQFIHGDPKSALGHPSALVLTESSAQRYFGHSNPLGKTVNINNVPFQVTAVLADIAANSHFHFNALVSTASQKAINPDSDDQISWSSSNYKTYVKLIPKSNLEQVAARANTIFSKNREESPILRMQPLKDIHLYSHLRSEFEANGDINNVRFAAAIGLLILMVAVLNFMNLASAHSLNRSREVGLRKVLGAQRSQLVRQFLGEAGIFIFISSILGLGIAHGLLPYFRLLTGTELSWGYVPWHTLALFFLIVIILVGTVAGSYPAFFASRFQPIKALRGDKLTVSHRFSLRNLFVGIQFAITLIFVCAALIIWSQLQYIKNRQLGIENERIIYIELPRAARHHHQAIKTELLSLSGVIAATASDFLPSTNSQNIGSTWEGRIETEDVYLGKVSVDPDFISTFGIEVVAGKAFIPDNQPGSTYIVNETAAQLIGDGIIEQAVGKILDMGTWSSRPDRIIGVVKDFHFRSLHRAIEPLVLFLDASRIIVRPGAKQTYKLEPFRYVSARFKIENLDNITTHVQNICQKFIPYAAESWSFFDQDFDRLYAAEKRTAHFMVTLALTAVILAAMGLLGLSIYAVENRRKEIGIRRVMGASTTTILFLFFKDFFRIHLGSMIFAFPIIAYAMHNWLQNFAYRISLAPWIFILSAVFTAVLFFVTSSLNVYKNATANPAVCLRHE